MNQNRSQAMSLGVNSNRVYLNPKDGKLSLRGPSGEESLFDYVEGRLVGVSKRPREFKGEEVTYWYFDLLGEDGVTYSIATHYSSGVAKAIINSLASAIDSLGRIRIETYLSGEYTKTVVSNNGNRLPWRYQELPPVEELTLGGRKIKDDSKRMELFERMAEELVNKINQVKPIT